MSTYKTSKSREKILSTIRKALSKDAIPKPFPKADENLNQQIYAKDDVSAEETFATNFNALGGKFVYCDNEQQLLENLENLYQSSGWKQMLCADEKLLNTLKNNKINIAESAALQTENADACITTCESLVARTGSIILSSKQNFGRTASVFYPVHIVIAYSDQTVFDINDALTAIQKKYKDNIPSMINLNTGASRTADIEKTLVVGVHGPGEVFCFFVNA